MARLPVPGSDDGAWGDILNAFLLQSHNADGTIADNTIGDTQIASGSITDSHVSSFAAISKTKLAPGVQTSLNLADSSVQTVNGKTPAAGAVTLAASDVGALTQTTADGRYIAGTKSTSAPSSPSTNDLWYDSTNDLWKRWNGSSWVVTGSGSTGLPAFMVNLKVSHWAYCWGAAGFGTTQLSSGVNSTMQLVRVYLKSSHVYDAIGLSLNSAAVGGSNAVNGGVFADDGSGYAPQAGGAPLCSTGSLAGDMGVTGGKVYMLSTTWSPSADGYYWLGLAYTGTGVSTYPTFGTVNSGPFVSFVGMDTTSYNNRGFSVSQNATQSLTSLGATTGVNAPWHIGIRRSA